jgi:hypothetical protein
MRVGSFANCALFFAAAAFMAASARAGEQVAIVEEASGGSGLLPMEYLETGRTIALQPGQMAVIGYFRSCVRERIAGGSIVIGTGQSAIVGGVVSREQVDCAGTAAQVDAASGESGVIVFRKPVRVSTEPAVQTVFSPQPLFRLLAPGLLRLRRVDAPEPALEFAVPSTAFDLASTPTQLAPGASYRAESGGSSVSFKIDPGARPGQMPVLSRIVRF